MSVWPIKTLVYIHIYIYVCVCVCVCVNNHGRKLILVMDRASKKRRNKTAFGTRGQTETSLKIEDLLSNKTTGNFHKSLREFYIIIFLNKLKMVENTHQKYEKNQNKTSVAKRFTGPFLALRAPDRCSYWNPSRRHWLWRGQLFMRCFVIPQALRSWAIYDTKSLLFRNHKTYFVSRLNRSFRKWWIKKNKKRYVWN